MSEHLKDVKRNSPNRNNWWTFAQRRKGLRCMLCLLRVSAVVCVKTFLFATALPFDSRLIALKKRVGFYAHIIAIAV